MKRSFLIAVCITAVALAVAAATTTPNFAGTWSVDKAKSQGLSQRMLAADSIVWTITQDDKTITIDTKLTGGQPPAGGAPGSSGGGGRGPGGPMSYKLDGTETSSDVTGQMTGKSTFKATWAGAVLELTRKSVLNGPNGEVTTSDSRKLSLSADGKVLTAIVHSESPRGTQDATIILNKQ